MTATVITDKMTVFDGMVSKTRVSTCSSVVAAFSFRAECAMPVGHDGACVSDDGWTWGGGNHMRDLAIGGITRSIR